MLVSIEGITGAGKTTVWEALRDVYPDAVFTREPTESWYGEVVRRSRSVEGTDPVAELFLHTADHAAHLADTVRPALADDELVVSDRYADSRYAHQAAALEGVIDRPMEYVRGVHLPFTREPDHTVYLDADPGTALARSGRADGAESREHLRRVRENYERLARAHGRRITRVDGTRPPEDVISEVEDLLARWVD